MPAFIRLGEIPTFFSLSEEKQKDGKRSFAESFFGTAAVAEVSEQVQGATVFVGICPNSFVPYCFPLASLVTHENEDLELCAHQRQVKVWALRCFSLSTLSG